MRPLTKNKKVRYGMLIAFAFQLLLPVLIPCQSLAALGEETDSLQLVICTPSGLKTVTVKAGENDSGENQTEHEDINTVCAACGTMSCQVALDAEPAKAELVAELIEAATLKPPHEIEHLGQACTRLHAPRGPPSQDT